MLKKKYLSLLIAALAVTACDSDDDKNSSQAETGITVSFKAVATGDVEPEYLITQSSLLEGEVSATGTGYEQQGWNFFYPVGNTLFVAGYENYEATSYKVDSNNDVAPLSTFVFDDFLGMFGNVDDTVLLASDQSSGTHTSRTLYTVSAETGLVTDKINYTIFDEDTGTAGEGTVGYAMGLVVRGDELFIPFHKLDDLGYFTTPDADTAYVAVYDYPLTDGAAPKAIISDDRASHVGVNGMTTNMIQTETGDLYTLHNGSSAAGFSPASTKKSAILRINANESEFDANYYFDIEAAADGGKLFWFDYVGDNKVIARIIVNEDNAYPWSAYYKDLFTQKLVIIDLANQTITDVAGVPLHQKRYTSPIEVMDGKVYVSIETADDAFVYQVDIASATAIKGAEIQGKTIKGFYDLYN